MKRGLVLIGVARVDSLRTLKAVESGVQLMRDWGESQGMHVIEILDQVSTVEITRVREAVNEMLSKDTLVQLWIYFAGHGINIGYKDYWLLSNSASESGEAIDFNESVLRAEHCNLEHVIFVADTCRQIPKTQRFHGITGTPIFQNVNAANGRARVDRYLSSQIGQPSFEVDDLSNISGFRALYTELFCEVLSGKHPYLHDADEIEQTEVVRPWQVSDFLFENVPKRHLEYSVPANRIPVPDSRIQSRPEAWLSDVSKYNLPQQNVKTIEELNREETE